MAAECSSSHQRRAPSALSSQNSPGVPRAAAWLLCLDAREEGQSILELPLGKEHCAHTLGNEDICYLLAVLGV